MFGDCVVDIGVLSDHIVMSLVLILSANLDLLVLSWMVGMVWSPRVSLLLLLLLAAVDSSRSCCGW